MSVKMSRKAKGVLAVTVAASINGALFAPTAMAVEQEPISESRLATGKRINTNLNTNNDALDRGLTKCQSVDNELDEGFSPIKDVDMEPELEQAEQAPQRVLQLLGGDEGDKASETSEPLRLNQAESKSLEARAEAQSLSQAKSQRLAVSEKAQAQSEGMKLSTGMRINPDEETTSDSLDNNDTRLNQAGDDGLSRNPDRLNPATRDDCDVDNVVAEKQPQVETPVTDKAPTDSGDATGPTAVSDAAPVETVTTEDDGVHAATSGSSEDGTQTLAKTGSETTLFAGIAAAIAGAFGAMLMWFSRKQKRQS